MRARFSFERYVDSMQEEFATLRTNMAFSLGSELIARQLEVLEEKVSKLKQFASDQNLSLRHRIEEKPEFEVRNFQSMLAQAHSNLTELQVITGSLSPQFGLTNEILPKFDELRKIASNLETLEIHDGVTYTPPDLSSPRQRGDDAEDEFVNIRSRLRDVIFDLENSQGCSVLSGDCV